MSGAGGPLANASAAVAVLPDPQGRVFDAIDRARVALGKVDPLPDTERRMTADWLAHVCGVPQAPQI